MLDIFQPIILSGGNGVRLWPLSNSNSPKQLIKINNDNNMLEETILRIKLLSNKLNNKYRIRKPLIIINKNNRLIESENYNICYEEYSNDTTIAIANGLKNIKENCILLIVPSDHYIEYIDNFINDVYNSINNYITENNIILFGIKPNSIETKYGYIYSSNTSDSLSFIEKPNIDKAKELIKNGAYWNSGIFLTNSILLNKLMKNKSWINDYVENPKEGKCPSFDVSIIQDFKNIKLVKCNWNWNDLGTWDAFINIPYISKDLNNNCNLINCNNTKVLNKDKYKNITIVNCSDILIVLNEGNLLILNKQIETSSDIKEIISYINKENKENNNYLKNCNNIEILNKDKNIIVIGCSNILIFFDKQNLIIINKNI